MKKITVLLNIIVFTLTINAQDVIMYKNGDEVNAKVLSVSKQQITFKKTENINGPEYSEEISNLFMIKYKNGDKDVFANTNEEVLENKKNIGKEISYFQGVPVISYTENDVVIAMSLRYGRQYGKYYIAEVLIYNNTGKNIDFIPSQFIMASYIKNGIATDAKILTYDEYTKKVKNAQGWRTFALAFAESYNASQAGYSSSSTSGSASIYGNSTTNYDVNAYGSNGSWANAYGTSNTSGSAHIYGSSTTQSYNGAANYAAQQNASRNIGNFEAYQKQKRNSIQHEYLKRHTIQNGEELSGKINIKYTRASNVELSLLVNGKEYIFDFTSDLIKKIDN